MLIHIIWLCFGGALGYWLSAELAAWLVAWLLPITGTVDALLWSQLVHLGLLILLGFALLQLARRQRFLHALAGALVLPLLVIVSWSGTLSLYRAELDLALTSALAPVRAQALQPQQLPAAAQQLQLALQWQQQQAPSAARLYVELASARKPYLTLHVQQPGRRNLTRYWLQLPVAGSPTGLTALGDALELQPGSSRLSVGELFFSVHYQLAGLLQRSAAPLLTGLSITVLALTLSGVWLLWQRWRTSSMPLFGRGPLSWHLAGAVLTLPWLWWFFGSALLTQYGNWHPGLLKQDLSAAYYQALFPLPQPAPAVTAATAPDLAALLQKPGWPVAKVQFDFERGTYLLTEQPAWPQSPPYQLRQQTLDATLQVLPQAEYWQSAPWQLRNLGYAAHQSLYAGPWLRALLALGGVCAVLMLCAAAEGYGRRQSWWLLGLYRALTSGFVLASCLMLWLEPRASLLNLLGISWFCTALLLVAATAWQYRQRT
jgi:hypothetical protein